MFLERKHGKLVFKAWSTFFIIAIRSILVVLFNNLHDERDKSLNEYLAALGKVAPFLEQVNELLSKVSFTMVVTEEL